MTFRKTLRRLCASLNSGRRPKASKKSRPLGVEYLEDRWVLSTLQLSGGVLTYTAGAGIANKLTVSISGATYTFTDTAEPITVTGISGATGSGTNTVTIPASQVQPAGMLLDLGDKADSLTVLSTVNAISVKAGADNDTIDIGRLGTGALSAIQAAVSVDGESGSDLLRVNDPASGAARTYTVTTTSVKPTGGFDVSYAGTESVALTAGGLADTFNVQSTALGTAMTINEGAGNDTANVGSTANTLDDIQGVLSLNGQAGVDSLNLRDQGSSAGQSYTLTSGKLTRSGGVLTGYSGMESLELDAGAFDDNVAVQSTAAATPINLNTGAGGDTVSLGNAAHSLDGIASLVTVNGQAGTDAVVLDDSGDANGNTYVITSSDVTRDGTRVLSYAGAESLTLLADNFADTATVQSTLAATPVALSMGGGNDVINVGRANSLDLIKGAVKVDGQAGADTLSLLDSGNNNGNAYTVTATAVVSSEGPSVTYAGAENLFLNAPNFLNIIAVRSTSAKTTVTGGLGVDLVLVGSAGNSMDDIKGTLVLNTGAGADQVTLADNGDADANSYTVTATSVSRSGAAPIFYAGAESLTVSAGAQNDTFVVQATSATTPVTLGLGGGNDTVTLGNASKSLDGILSTVSVVGQTGADAVVLDDSGDTSPNSYVITSKDVTRNGLKVLSYGTDLESLTLLAGAVSDTIAVQSTQAVTPVVVQAGSGNDTITVGGTNASALLGAVTVDGQAGSDTLDYTAFTSAVRVNLDAGTATGLAGLSNVENANGGAADDILIGNGAANVLKGRAGRDLMIGRGGKDTLLGEAGDDILIGASTVLDTDTLALEAIMAEWGRTGLPGTAQDQFNTRVNDLILGGGLNGTTTLDVTKVVDDGVADTLNGGGDIDWFFISAGVDSIVGLVTGERVN